MQPRLATSVRSSQRSTSSSASSVLLLSSPSSTSLVTMAAVSLPLPFTGVGVQQLGAPLVRLPRSVSSLGPDELLVHNSYSSINPLDMKTSRHNMFRSALPIVLGCDYSGTVVAVGGEPSEGQEAIGVGSEVFGLRMASDCWAEYVVAKRQFIALRGAIPARDAGVYGGVFFTAVDGVVVSGEVSRRSGQWIYIAGAAGGVGHIAVQLAKLHGLKVIGSASKLAALALLKQLAVDHIIDYSTQDVLTEVLAATNGMGADVVYDPTGSLASFAQSAACVARGGVWIKLGLNRTQPGSDVYSKVAEARGATVITPTIGRWFPHMGGEEPYVSQQSSMTRALRDAVGWYESGQLRVHISRTVECEPTELQQAFEDFNQMNVGKVAVHIAHAE